MSRRSIAFATLDDAVRDAEALLAAGCDKTGQWNLGQTCGHLANWLGYAMDGFPKAPPPIRLLMWTLRNTLGPGALKRILAAGAMRPGTPTAPQSVPGASFDDREGVEAYKAMVERANRFAGTPLPSPFFGPMSRDEWVKLNCVHAAHHLGFLTPKHA